MLNQDNCLNKANQAIIQEHQIKFGGFSSVNSLLKLVPIFRLLSLAAARSASVWRETEFGAGRAPGILVSS